MPATIMMPQQIDAAIKDMCSDTMHQTVAALAEKYGFDVEEAKIDNLINILRDVLKHPFSISIGDNLKNMKFEHF